jgi:lipopolysaccharide/colanic/teichoic acid biosynthesis glycosyltransferase
MITLAAFIFIFSLLAIFYHHIGYPILLSYFSAHHPKSDVKCDDKFNKFIFIIPMYNEAIYVAEKIANLADLDYPKDYYEVLLLDDGSTDKTSALAKEAIKNHPDLRIKIQSYPLNQGKVALYNLVIPNIPEDYILFFSDTSASLSTNVLQRANSYFNNPQIGAFCAKYQLKNQALTGEEYYWHYQNAIKSKESCLGTPIGYHGAGYALRKRLWKKLPANTINDDFVMPLKIIEQGFLGIYDEESFSTENEPSYAHLDWMRRVRIASGNIQQVFYLFPLLSPRQGYIAWMFFSGKVLRIFMPFFFMLLLISTLVLAVYNPFFFLPILLGQLLFYLIPILNYCFPTKHFKIGSYFIKGHYALFMGWFYLLKRNTTPQWKRAKSLKKIPYIHPLVFVGKWIIDKISALIGLTFLLCIIPFIALIIKSSSPGPIFYRQLRVGKGTEKQTNFFFLYKFRTMKAGANFSTSRWTTVNDPRIFSFGNFLRKTHIDELPQFYNILKGDMSLVGPRPERLSYYHYLEKNIPFYEERLFEVLPGLTGLAQVTFVYDNTIEDVRKKVAADHAYATYLTRPWVWFKMEIVILIKTISVVLYRKGQ